MNRLKPTYEELEKQVQALSNADVERKLSLEKLRLSEERFRNLIEGSVQGILIHREHKPLFVNEKWAMIHGYSPEEILGMDTIVQLISPTDQKRMLAYRKARLAGKGAPTDYEYQGVHRDGSFIWLDNRVHIVQWEGRPAIQTTIFNITHRKQAEAEKERLIDELKDALLEVKTLQGIIPICAHCKNVRDDQGYWQRVESYVRERSQAEFSHGICPDCVEKYYSDIDR